MRGLDAIGETFDFSLPSVRGDALSMVDYRGKIVLLDILDDGFHAVVADCSDA